jgi:hypothetical protein
MPLGHHVLPDSMIRDDIYRKNMGDDYDKKEKYAEGIKYYYRQGLKGLHTHDKDKIMIYSFSISECSILFSSSLDLLEIVHPFLCSALWHNIDSQQRIYDFHFAGVQDSEQSHFLACFYQTSGFGLNVAFDVFG